jgi:hypothetical protein
MIDKTTTPTLEELQAQFPYDPTTENISAPTKSSPINIDNVTVFELYDWNAFTMKLASFPFTTLHFVGKCNIDGKSITYYTGALQPYDKQNDWYMPIKEWTERRPFRLTGTRDIYEEFPQPVINSLQATEIMPIVRPESYRYPHFNPSEQNG